MISAFKETAAKPYEQSLVRLGHFIGATDSFGDGGQTAAPDATWIFDNALWVCWEAKSKAEPSGELGATDVRQAGSHLRFVQAQLSKTIPAGSVVLLMTPQERVHGAAEAVAEPHVYIVRPDHALALAQRLVRAWRALRSRTASPTQQDVLSVFGAEHALPSQWLPGLLLRTLAPKEPDLDS